MEVSGFVGGDWLVKDGGLHFGEFALNNDVLINLGVGTNIVLVLWIQNSQSLVIQFSYKFVHTFALALHEGLLLLILHHQLLGRRVQLGFHFPFIWLTDGCCIRWRWHFRIIHVWKLWLIVIHYNLSLLLKFVGLTYIIVLPETSGRCQATIALMWFAQAWSNETLKSLAIFLSKLILSQSQHLCPGFFLAWNREVALSKDRVSSRYPSLTSLRPCHYYRRLIWFSLRHQRIGRQSLLRQEIRSGFHLRLQGNLFGQNSFVAQFWIKQLILKLGTMSLT